MGRDPLGAIRAIANHAAVASLGPIGFQWRERDLSAEETLERLGPLPLDAPPPSLRFLLNDDVETAARAGQRIGVHLREASRPTLDARRALGPERLIGRSVHGADSARRAADEGADFVVLGPVFETPSKQAYGRPIGLDALREAARATSIPVFAIGGITAERVPDCRSAGAHGVAVIRAVWDDVDPAEATARLLRLAGV